MFARLAIVGLIALGFAGPCGAVVMEQATQHPYAAPAVATGEVGDDAVVSWQSFSFAIPDLPPHRSSLERVFSVPNIAVALAGLAWLTLVRRRLAGGRQTSEQ